jgi:hypothetical protein
VARVTDPVVRVESPVLDHLGLTGLTGLTALTGLTGLVPDARSAATAPGVVELGPGQRLSLLCQGPLSPLCTEIAVTPAQGPSTTADGRTGVSAATVSVRLFQVPALPLPVVGAGPGSDAGSGTATPLDPLALAGLGVGAKAPTGGVELVIGAARAEAGPGGAVGAAPAAGTDGAGWISAAGFERGAPSPAAPESPASRPADGHDPTAAGTLPRTGGVPFDPALVPLAVLGSVGLAAGARLLRRA